MLRRIDHLKMKADELVDVITRVMPEMYQQRPAGKDPVASAWNAALSGATAASSALGELQELVRKRAGIPEPEPQKASQDTAENRVWLDPPDSRMPSRNWEQPGFDDIPW